MCDPDQQATLNASLLANLMQFAAILSLLYVAGGNCGL